MEKLLCLGNVMPRSSFKAMRSALPCKGSSSSKKKTVHLLRNVEKHNYQIYVLDRAVTVETCCNGALLCQPTDLCCW